MVAMEGVWQKWKVYGSNGRCMVAMEGVWSKKVYGNNRRRTVWTVVE